MLLHHREQLPHWAVFCVFSIRCHIVHVVAAVCALSDNQCMSDPLPNKLLKDNVDMLAPFLVELYNQSLAVGVVLSIFKSVYITLLLKKADIDPVDVKS